MRSFRFHPLGLVLVVSRSTIAKEEEEEEEEGKKEAAFTSAWLIRFYWLGKIYRHAVLHMIDSRRFSRFLDDTVLCLPFFFFFFSLFHFCSFRLFHYRAHDAIVSFCPRHQYWLRNSKTYPLNSTFFFHDIASTRYFSNHPARKWNPFIESSVFVVHGWWIYTYICVCRDRRRRLSLRIWMFLGWLVR